MDKASEFGSGWVSVCKHQSLRHCLVLFSASHRARHDRLVDDEYNQARSAAVGAERMLGTNPISIAFPRFKKSSIVVDLATSAAAYGKIEIARRKNLPVPKGWIIDKEGTMTTSPDDMINGGALLRWVSDRELGGHKGYALSAMVDILTSVLSGANWGPFAPPLPCDRKIPSRSVGKGMGISLVQWR